MTRVFSSIILMLSMTVAASAAEETNAGGEITVTPKPDVVIETLTFMMPNTTKRAMEMADKIVIPEDTLSVINALQSMAPEQSEFKHLKFQGGVYDPYTDPSDSAYQTTAMYRIFDTVKDKSDITVLPMIKQFNFERVLGAFNYVLVVLAGALIAIAIWRMSWVSMTVEDNTKAWKKMLISTPAILIAMIMIKPMDDLGGVSLAQLLMVFAVVVSNYFAANFALVASSSLFTHIVKTTSNSDEAQMVFTRMAENDIKDLISGMVVSANQKLIAEESIGMKVFSLIEGKPLTNETLRAGIAKFNDVNQLTGTEFELNATCFGSDWSERFSIDAGCKFLLQRMGEGRISIRSRDQVRYDGSIKLMNASIPDNEANEALKFNHDSYSGEVTKHIPNVEMAFNEIYRYQKQSYCANKARQGHFSAISGWSYDAFDASFVCKVRDESDGFGTSGEFYGATGVAGGKMLPVPAEVNAETIYSNIKAVIFGAGGSSRISQIQFSSNDYAFYHRGFFISPIESVMTAVGYLLKFDSEYADMRNSLKSQFAKSIVKDAVSTINRVKIPLDRVARHSIGQGLSESENLAEKVASHTNHENTQGWFNVLLHLDELTVSKSGDEGAPILEDVRLKTIEPYSYMQSMYNTLLPISGVILIVASGMKLVLSQEVVEANTMFLILMKTMFTTGGLLFLTAILAKLVAGAFFLWAAISLLFLSLKRFLIYLIASPLMAIKFLKEQFSETEDDDDNITVSRYLLSAMFRLSIDLSMVFVALMAAFVIGTIASNLAAYMVVIYASTISELSSNGIADFLTTIMTVIALNLALIWGMYRGVKATNYVYDKTTDFVDDITGVKAEAAHEELLGFVKTSILPTHYLK